MVALSLLSLIICYAAYRRKLAYDRDAAVAYVSSMAMSDLNGDGAAALGVGGSRLRSSSGGGAAYAMVDSSGAINGVNSGSGDRFDAEELKQLDSVLAAADISGATDTDDAAAAAAAAPANGHSSIAVALSSGDSKSDKQ